MEAIHAMGQFFHQVLSYRGDYVLSLLICEVLFSISAKPRRFPHLKPTWLLIPVAICAYLIFGLAMPLLPVGTLSVSLLTLMIFLMSLLLQWAVLDLSGWRVLFNSTAAYAMQNLGLNAFEVIAALLGVSGGIRFLLKIVVLSAVYASCYFVFARKTQRRELHLNKPVIIQLACMTILICNILFSYFAFKSMGAAIKIPLAICCFLALQVQFASFHDSSLNREKEILEQLLFREQKQHKLLQETIDIINIKSHDLKHHIGMLRSNLGEGSKGADEFVREVENAIRDYDCIVQTGNESLDLIISEEKLLCEKYGVPFDVMADGAALDFIQPVDLYSLIGNALRNAVESSLKEPMDQRGILLDIHTSGVYVCVKVVNYCSQPLTFVNGHPVTSKKDNRFHGFGLKSMEYVVNKYGGNMVIDYRDSTFVVKMIFPLSGSSPQ